MKKYMYGALFILYVPVLFFAQQDAQRLFVWDNDRGKSNQDNPVVGLLDNGHGYASWDDARWGDYDVYGQEYNMEKMLVGKNFSISIDEYNRLQQHNADISCNTKNYFISVWEESLFNPEQKPSVIFAKMKEKEPYLVYAHEMSQKFPSISSKADGWYAISWTSYRGGPEPSILCKIYDEGGSEVKMNEVCEKVQITAGVPLSNVAYCEKGGLVVYEDYEGSTARSIYGQSFKPDGNIAIDRFKVSYYSGGSEKDEWDPDVAVNEAGHMVVVWVDNYLGLNRIFGQRIEIDGGGCNFVGDPFEVERDGKNNQANPRVAMFPYTGGDFSYFLVVWEEDMGADWNARGLVFKDQGSFQPFDIPEQNIGNQRQPYAAARWGDIVSIVWSCWYNNRYHPDVFLRNFKRDDTETGLSALGSHDIPLVPTDPDTGVGGRKCWYFDNENYDNPATPDWNEDPIPEGPPQYVDLDFAVVDQLMELNTNGQYVIECADTLPYKQGKALSDYDGIFLDLGYRTIFSSAGTITQAERVDLSNYVETTGDGGPIMVDGNDFGYMYDTTVFFMKFGAKYLGDGGPYTDGNIDTLLGHEIAKDMRLPYAYKDLPDNYPDSLSYLSDDGRIILDVEFPVGEWYAGYSIGYSMAWDDGRYHYSTIYNSFIPSAMTGTIHPHTYAEFYRRCLGHMGLEVQPEPIVDLEADTMYLNEGEVELFWTIVCDDSLNDPVNDGYELKFSRTKMTSEAAYDAAEEYYQTWTTPGNVDDPVSKICTGLPPMDTLVFTLKVEDDHGLINALGAEPLMRVKGDSVTPHNILIGGNYVRDFSRRYEFLHRYPHLTGDDSLFVSWDYDSFYIGLAGQSFDSGGDLLIYFDISNGSGADSTYPYHGTTLNCAPFHAASGEFRPDYCLILETYNSCLLYQCTGKDSRDIWTARTFHGSYSEDNVLNGYEYTEISIPFTDFSGYSTSNQFEMVVTIQNESNNLRTHIYPPFNPIGIGTITQYYRWTRLVEDMVPKYTAGIIGIAEQQSTPDPEMFGKTLLAMPNPFRNTIDLLLNQSLVASSEHATLRIFDVTGRVVRNFDLEQYSNSSILKITWDGKDDRSKQVARGIYFCELVTDKQTVMEKVIYIR
ncbi:T9SS type A sorting domain-containing protein [candidate division WOR-3 bacterium]|nr:T9SS type A sorting domain-containing protein [candidate division WOR-3 bacterium]